MKVHRCKRLPEVRKPSRPKKACTYCLSMDMRGSMPTVRRSQSAMETKRSSKRLQTCLRDYCIYRVITARFWCSIAVMLLRLTHTCHRSTILEWWCMGPPPTKKRLRYEQKLQVA